MFWSVARENARRRAVCVVYTQCLWRCYAAQPSQSFPATWRPHLQQNSHHHHQHGHYSFGKSHRRISSKRKARLEAVAAAAAQNANNSVVDRKELDRAHSITTSTDGQCLLRVVYIVLVSDFLAVWSVIALILKVLNVRSNEVLALLYVRWTARKQYVQPVICFSYIRSTISVKFSTASVWYRRAASRGDRYVWVVTNTTAAAANKLPSFSINILRTQFACSRRNFLCTVYALPCAAHF